MGLRAMGLRAMGLRAMGLRAMGMALLLVACADVVGGTSVAGTGGQSATNVGGAGAGDGAGGNGGTSSAGGSSALPTQFTVEGVVVDGTMTPVADALVMQGGKPEAMVTTNDAGEFAVDIVYGGFGLPAVIAAKTGYRANGIELFELPTAPVQLILGSIEGSDNVDYTYNDPGDGVDTSKEDCTHCHTTFVSQFFTSKHKVAASDPLVQDLYAGVSRAHTDQQSCETAGGDWKQGLEPGTATTALAKCYLGGGVLPDLNTSCGGDDEPACDDPAIEPDDAPAAFGACADCHAPGIDGVAGGRNLHDAVGLSYDLGVHCDPCHKVSDIDLNLPPGVGQRLILHRPNEPGTNMFEFKPLFFGPLPDVPNIVMGGSYQPKFKSAVLCAGCHQQEQPALLPGDALDADRWPDGLPVHSTYDEWAAGPYASPETPCQHCHMPERFDMNNSLDISTVENQSITFGFPRPPERTRQHTFRSPLAGSPRLIDGALYVSLDLAIDAGELTANVSLSNVGCGHALPTGEPMRSLVLVVDALGDGSCATPTPSGGMTINDTGGARASGTEGDDITTAGTTMTWAAGAAIANEGDEVRVVRPTGSYDDYAAPIGLFQTLPAADKGMEIHMPVGRAAVVSSDGGIITLDAPLTLQAGDVVFIGDTLTDLPSDLTDLPSDGDDSRRLAGAPGYSFARVLVDSSGARHVPHYRAVDMASDNRIPPGDSALTTHTFSVPGDCSQATVRATVLYRPVPTAMAELRGWEAKDYAIASAESVLATP